MQLIIACGIDANNNGVPLAWALVPIEDEYWWTWFFEHLYIALQNSRQEGQIFMSDREKGFLQPLKRYIHLLFMGIVVSILQTIYKPSLEMHVGLFSRHVRERKPR